MAMRRGVVDCGVHGRLGSGELDWRRSRRGKGEVIVDAGVDKRVVVVADVVGNVVVVVAVVELSDGPPVGICGVQH